MKRMKRIMTMLLTLALLISGARPMPAEPPGDGEGIENGVLTNAVVTIKDNVADVPEGVKVIAGGAFDEVWDLKEIILPESLEEIANGGFRLCSAYKITIPKNVKTIGDNAFGGAFFREMFVENMDAVIADNAFYNWKWSNSCIIYGHENSTIQKFAVEKNLKFWNVDKYPISTVEGDVNWDKKCNLEDALITLKWGLHINSYVREEKICADLDDDGIITLADAKQILIKALKIV